MPEEFVGRVASGSWPPWNRVCTERQKRRLHHMRDLKKTIQENKSPEFQAFAKKPTHVLWDLHGMEKGCDPTGTFKPGSGSGAAWCGGWPI